MSSYTVDGLTITITLDDEQIPSASGAIVITSADFTSGTYQNDRLIDLTADVDFVVFSDYGSGTLLKVNDGYAFDSATGTITATPENYRIIIL